MSGDVFGALESGQTVPVWERVWTLRDLARVPMGGELVAEIRAQSHQKFIPRGESEVGHPVILRYEPIDEIGDVQVGAVGCVQSESAAVDVQCDCHKNSSTGRSAQPDTARDFPLTVEACADTPRPDSSGRVSAQHVDPLNAFIERHPVTSVALGALSAWVWALLVVSW